MRVDINCGYYVVEPETLVLQIKLKKIKEYPSNLVISEIFGEQINQ